MDTFLLILIVAVAFVMGCAVGVIYLTVKESKKTNVMDEIMEANYELLEVLKEINEENNELLQRIYDLEGEGESWKRGDA